MPGTNDVHLIDFDLAEIQDLFYNISVEFVSVRKTIVVICRLPQWGALLKAHYQISY